MTLEKIAEILEEQGCDQVAIRDDEVWCCCPLHDESTPSFSVNVEKGVYNCFVCGGGSLAKLLKMWGYDASSLRYQGADRLGDRVRDLRRHEAPIHRLELGGKTRSRSYGTLSERGVEYLKGRGFDAGQIADLARSWDLWTSRGRDGELLHFPVRSPNMGPVMFEATRSLVGKQYRYPKGAKKSEVLYGQHLVPLFTPPILRVAQRQRLLSVIVVEGIFDALKVWSFGFEVVALLGARPSNRQIEMLLRADEVIWALDNDVAGRVGTGEGFRALRGSAVKQSVLYLGPCKDPGEVPDRDSFLKLLSLSLSQGSEISYPGSRSLSQRLDRVRRPGAA